MKYDWLKEFQGTQITDLNDEQQVSAAVRDHRLMVLCVLDRILRRYERDSSYPFIDTKLSLITGQDFPADDPIRGKNVVYSWIQGRGLEAIAGHLMWLPTQMDLGREFIMDFDTRLRGMLRRVMTQMEIIRARNGGRLFFMMTPDGQPLRLTADMQVVPHSLPPGSPTGVSEMFYCKGLVAAGMALGDRSAINEACKLFGEVVGDIATGRFYSDQQQFDPRNPVLPVPDRFGHGSRMLGIGACARFLECTLNSEYSRIGLEYIDHILSYHVNTSMNPEIGKPFDMWEFVDRHGRPWVEDGVLKSDPGHATEFVGLALKLIHLTEMYVTMTDHLMAKLRRFRTLLPQVLERNFTNGFSARGRGIVKAYDLASRKPINDQMPWWSLPETMRAAIEAFFVATPERQPALARVAAECSNAFFKYYVRPDRGLMATQTLQPDGSVADVVPATPDADPGYHTGLSIIDCLELLSDF